VEPTNGSIGKRKAHSAMQNGPKLVFVRALVSRDQPFDADHAGSHEKASNDDPQHGNRFFVTYSLNL
jgi:hypothetical protein